MSVIIRHSPFYFVPPRSGCTKAGVFPLQTRVDSLWRLPVNTSSEGKAKFFRFRGSSEAQVHGFLAVKIPVFFAADRAAHLFRAVPHSALRTALFLHLLQLVVPLRRNGGCFFFAHRDS